MARERDLVVENIGAEVCVTAMDDTVAGTSKNLLFMSYFMLMSIL